MSFWGLDEFGRSIYEDAEETTEETEGTGTNSGTQPAAA